MFGNNKKKVIYPPGTAIKKITFFATSLTKCRKYITITKKKKKSSSIGAKIVSFVFRQLKKKILKKNLSNIEYQSHILANKNL